MVSPVMVHVTLYFVQSDFFHSLVHTQCIPKEKRHCSKPYVSAACCFLDSEKQANRTLDQKTPSGKHLCR